MPGPEALEVLTAWVTNLSQLRRICIQNGWNKADGVKPNPFAVMKVIATVADGTDFLSKVKDRFPGFDPKNPNFTLGDNSDFAEVTNWVSPFYLLDAADFYIRTTSGRGRAVIPMNTKVTDLFSEGTWKDFVKGIRDSKLAEVLGESAKVLTDLDAYHAEGSDKTYPVLVTFLSTIQDPKGGK